MDLQSATIQTHVDRDLALRGRIGAFLYPAVSGALGLWTGQFQIQPVLMSLVLANALVLAMWRSVFLKEATGTSPSRPHWRRRFLANILLNGLNWAFFAITVALQGATSIPFLMVIIGTAGIALGGAVTLAPDLKLVRLFLCTTLLPIAFVCGIGIGGEARNLAVLIVIYIFFCAAVARSLHREYWALLEANLTLQDSTEELRVARDQAEAATRAKSDFLATMSHELRTPMNGVIGMADMLLDKPLEEEAREFAHIIRASGEQLLLVINDILDFSKLEAGKLELESGPIPVRQTVRQTMDMLAQQAHGKGLELVFHCEPQVPEQLRGDQVRLRQIMLNLLTNAIKFTRQGDVVLHLDWRPETHTSGQLVLEVRDTGLGISQEQQAFIFQPFTQADSSTTRKFGGTGLGLSIVIRLVEAMGGAIGLDSTPGAGSTFTVTLPLIAGQERPAGPDQDPPFAGRVLLLAKHRPTARAVAAAIGPDLICLDSHDEWGHPGSPELDAQFVIIDDGILADQAKHAEVVDRLAQEFLAGTPVIILTRRHPAEWSLTIPEDWHLLRKPFCRDTLREGLRKAAATGQVSANSTPSGPSGDRRSRPILQVLVAEDNPFNQKVIQHQLTSLGCQVEVAEDGRLAVEALLARDFDVVFMDCQMPVLDGFAATSEIRNLPDPKGRIPIVALTANALAGDEEACLSAGMDRFLGKPIKRGQITQVLEDLGLLETV